MCVFLYFSVSQHIFLYNSNLAPLSGASQKYVFVESPISTHLCYHPSLMPGQGSLVRYDAQLIVLKNRASRDFIFLLFFATIRQNKEIHTLQSQVWYNSLIIVLFKQHFHAEIQKATIRPLKDKRNLSTLTLDPAKWVRFVAC